MIHTRSKYARQIILEDQRMLMSIGKEFIVKNDLVFPLGHY